MQKIIFSIFVLLLCSTIYAKSLTLVTLESPPSEYSENNIAKGSNVDIVKEALKRIGYDVNIQFVPWKRALFMVEKGQADGVIDAAYTKERAQYMYYPEEEIYIEEWYAFKKKDANITLDKDFQNAKDIRLGITRGFSYGGKIQDAIDNNMFIFLDESYNNELNLKKVDAGRFDMFLGVKKTVFQLAKKLGYEDKISIVKMTETNKDYLLNLSKTYLGFSKKRVSQELVDSFSNALSIMKEDGTIEKINKKY